MIGWELKRAKSGCVENKIYIAGLVDFLGDVWGLTVAHSKFNSRILSISAKREKKMVMYTQGNIHCCID